MSFDISDSITGKYWHINANNEKVWLNFRGRVLTSFDDDGMFIIELAHGGKILIDVSDVEITCTKL